jgi:predicted nucleic acid-binding protein
VWVEYLRAESPAPRKSPRQSPVEALDASLEQEQVMMCEPVAAELLAGARGPQREALTAQLRAQPWIELRYADWLAIGEAAAELGERGQTTPLIDVQIALCAVIAEAELWTRDRDFERVAAVLDGLRLRLFE